MVQDWEHTRKREKGEIYYLDSIIEEESSSISPEEEARIRAQVHEVMNQKFAANRM